MRNLKKLLALVLALMMVVSVMVTVNAATYTDLSSVDADYQEAVSLLKELGVMEGMTKDTFGPKTNITRAQMAAIAYRLMTGDTAGYGADKSAVFAPYAAKFTDVNQKGWYVGYIGYCVSAGIVVGRSSTTFDPDAMINGYEVLTMLLRCVGYGQNHEYEGNGYEVNVGADAKRLGVVLGTTGLNAKTPRQEVAQMTYNAALKAPRVTYVNGKYSFVVNPRDPSSDETVSLIWSEKVGEKTATNVWGIPGATTTTYRYYWSFPAQKPGLTYKDVKTTETPKALINEYDAITECDVATKLGVDGTHYAITYTNGVENKNLWNNNEQKTAAMPFEAKDTVNKIGHEGRHFLAYANPKFDADKKEDGSNPKYIFVFIDTYLGVVTNTWGEVKDPAQHVIREAGATVSVSYNTASVGAGSTTAPITLEIEGNFSVGDKIGVNMTNYGTGTALKDKNVATATGSTIEDDVTLKPVTAKVTSITSDTTAAGNHNVGFIADGVQYYYNYTFNGKALDGSNVGQTYTLLLGHDNDVLDYQLAGTVSGYGVTQTAVVKQVNSKEYVVTYTILLPNGQTTTIDVVNNTGAVFASYSSAETYANTTMPAGNLVHYTNAGKYYAFIATGDNANRISDNNSKTVFESGRVEAADKNFPATAPVAGTAEGSAVNGALVNNNTVFFVANYVPDTSTVTANSGTDNLDKDYKMTGYSVYTGFQSIPDLAIAADSYLPDGSGGVAKVQHLTIQAFDVGADGKPVVPAAGAYAKYVLITGATKQTTPPAKIAVKDYAFLMTNDSFKQETDSSYIFGAIIEGEAGKTLQVALAAGLNIKTSGLYTYGNNINGQGYSEVYLMNTTGNTSLAAPYNADFELDADRYFYANGVLTLTSNSVASGSPTASAYYTVADGCKVFLVNPTTGTSVPSDLGALATSVYGEKSAIWYQLDEFGRIDLIYIVDTGTGGGGTTVPETASLKFDGTPTATGSANSITVSTGGVTATGAAKMDNTKVTAEIQKNYSGTGWGFFCNGTGDDLSLQSSGAGSITKITPTGATLEAGNYRMKITVKNDKGEVTTADWIYFSVAA